MRALNAYHTLVLGLKMLPMHLDKDYPTFLEYLEALPPENQETMLRQSMALVPLNHEEIMALIAFATDSNGIPFGNVNKDNLTIEEIFEICIAVCVEISKIKVDLVSKAEQKKNQQLLNRPARDTSQESGPVTA